jgi:transcriptional regulator with XRE-family HTH domain
MASESIHQGQVIQAYRRLRGLTQEELARRLGRSRRTIVSLEQQRTIPNIRLRRALALVLTVPPQLLDLNEQPLAAWSVAPSLSPLPTTPGLPLGEMEMRMLLDQVRLRFDVYYFTNARYAAEGLREQREYVENLLKQRSAHDRKILLIILSHLYMLDGMIARDALDYPTAEFCFQYASLVAQEASSPELEALALACRAVLFVRQRRETVALQCYDAARAMTRHASPALKAYLAIGTAEAQSLLKDEACFRTLEQAHRWLRLIDPADDPLLLYRSTRCSKQTLTDCWMACQAALGHSEPALEYYSDIESQEDPAMPRRQARMLIQCARLLYQNRDMSCCFYATEGFRRAKAIESYYNTQQVRDLALTLKARFPQDHRVQELIEIINTG